MSFSDIHTYIPIDQPPSVREKVRDGVSEYKVTAGDVPSFLYEDPKKYDPENVLTGFMQGFFLARVRSHQTFQSMI